MSKPKILITQKVPGPALDRLFEECDATLWEEERVMPRELLLEQVKDAEGVHLIWLDRIDEEFLEAAPRLRALSTYAVGHNNIDLNACTRRGIPVGFAPEEVTQATADTALALMLAASRRLVEGVEMVKAGKWGDWSPYTLLGHDVHGKTLGIIGLGRIGQAIARRAGGFDMKVIYHNRRPNPEAEQSLGVGYRSLDALLGESDIVVLAVPGGDATRRLMNAERLSQMKRGGYLVNVGRGEAVDSDALYDALASGHLAGAGLDVTDPEPMPPHHRLLTLPNCTVVPHIGTSTWETRALMTSTTVENLLRGLRGERLVHCANPEVFDR